MNRQEYLTSVDQKEAHHTYYAQLVTPRMIDLVEQAFGSRLHSHDYPFNTIPLYLWDNLARAIPWNAAKFKELGDGVTKAGQVCVLKQAAKILKER
jgi:hypothetical protein